MAQKKLVTHPPTKTSDADVDRYIREHWLTTYRLHCQLSAMSLPAAIPEGDSEEKPLRADVSKYRPEVFKSEKLTILKKIHKVALGKLLT